MRYQRSPKPPAQRQLLAAAGALLLLLLAALQILGGQGGPAPAARPPADAPRAADRARSSDLPAARADQLPPEAAETLALIASDGPFPFEKDGATFQNRERLLPIKPPGYYREYTVITPGEGDRGARRIVAGSGGELYYTDDHYASFVEVIP
jgi:ribonuclease T1